MSLEIPVLSLKSYLTGSQIHKDYFVHKMGQALMDVGFFSIVEHDVDPHLLQKAYQRAEVFFGLPEAVKEGYEQVQLAGQRGFTRFGREQAKDAKIPDLKEFWHVGPLDHADYPENIWPGEVRGFREVFSELYKSLEACSVALLEACALYIGEAPDLFTSMVKGGNSILRVIHYPPLVGQEAQGGMRAAPHEDINLITLLSEATSSGLEIMTPKGEWFPVPSHPGQIIVDTGDMLQNLTNGLYKSATHRVVNPDNSRDRRFSMPFFVHPASQVELGPLPSCLVKTGHKKVYRDITAGAFLAERLSEIGLSKRNHENHSVNITQRVDPPSDAKYFS